MIATVAPCSERAFSNALEGVAMKIFLGASHGILFNLSS